MTIAWVVILSAVGAASAGDRLILKQSFEHIAGGNVPVDWNAQGRWSVADAALRCDARSGEATLLLGGSDVRNVALVADVRFLSVTEDSRWAALLLREAGPEAPGVQFTLRKNPRSRNGLELAAKRAHSEGGGWRVFQTASASGAYVDGVTHRLRIEARGDLIRAFLDKRKIFECPRGAQVGSAGRVGLRVSGAVVEFDNIEIWELDAPTPADRRAGRARPLVIAHRGFSHRAPENTLAAYRLAIEAGADMAECDVYLSGDGVPVLLHDRNLKRTTGVDKTVDQLSLAELRQLDAGRWKSPRFAGERIPTLRETLDLVAGRLRLVIEIKSPAMEAQVIAAIRESDAKPSDVMIFSFRRDVVEKIARLEPRLPTTWLIGDMPSQEADRRKTLSEATRARASAIGLPKTRVDPAIVRLAHSTGFPVYVWTVNDPADMRYLIRIGVDGIITDRPDVLLEVLK